MEIVDEIPNRRTFYLSRENAGFLGFGAELKVVVDGVVESTVVVYGDTLHVISRHAQAQVSGDKERIMNTNRALPERFQYPKVTK